MIGLFVVVVGSYFCFALAIIFTYKEKWKKERKCIEKIENENNKI